MEVPLRVRRKSSRPIAVVAKPSTPTLKMEGSPGGVIVGIGVVDRVDIGVGEAIGIGTRVGVGVAADDAIDVGVGDNTRVGVADGVAD